MYGYLPPIRIGANYSSTQRYLGNPCSPMSMQCGTAEKFGNLVYFAILSQYNTEGSLQVGCLFLEMKMKQKRLRNHCGAFPKNQIQNNQIPINNTYMLIKGFSRDLCYYIVAECRWSISCHYCVNLDCVLVTDRHFHLAIASDIDSVCDQYFYQLAVVRVNCFHILSHFVDTKVGKIFGICNSLPKKK